MYIPALNIMEDKKEMIDFIKRFSFATLITAKDNFPTATHLPFSIAHKEQKVILTSHFAKANNHWKDVENNSVLVIFTEPHAYISTANYDKDIEVPTWNYMSVHIYGIAKLITEEEKLYKLLEESINYYEPEYQKQWQRMPNNYKRSMIKAIVGLEIIVTELQGKEKLSQNRSLSEKQKIINALGESNHINEQLIATYMKNKLL